MQGVKTKSGLPQPYNMRPKSNGFLTTPMKKLLAYAFLLLTIGYILYEVTPRPQKEDTRYELSSGANVEKDAKNVVSNQDLKDKLGDINLAEAHADSNHKIDG